MISVMAGEGVIWSQGDMLPQCRDDGIIPGKRASMVVGAGETDQDLAATQFSKNCVAYNIREF